MELRVFLDVLWKKRRTALIVFAAVFLTMLFFSVRVTPWYNARAKVWLKSSVGATDIGSDLGLNGTEAAADVSDVDRATQIALSTLLPSAAVVIDTLDLSRERYRYQAIKLIPFGRAALSVLGVDESDMRRPMKPRHLTQSSIFSKIFPRPYVGVAQHQETDLLEITARSPDYREAVAIANTIADVMRRKQLERVEHAYDSMMRRVDKSLGLARSNYTKALDEFLAFVTEERTLDFDTEQENVISRIADLKESIEENRLSSAASAAAIRSIEQELATVERFGRASEEMTQSDVVVSLKESLQSLQLSLAEARASYTSEHPDVIALERQVAVIKELLAGEEDFVKGAETLSVRPVVESMEDSLATYRTEVSEQEARAKVLPRLMESYQDAIPGLAANTQRYADLEEALRLARDTYSELLESRQRLELARGLAVSRLSLVEPAVFDEEDRRHHKYPRIGMNALIGTILGVVFGLGWTILSAYVGDTVMATGAGPILNNQPILAEVPCLSRKKLSAALPRAGAGQIPQALRLLRHRLMPLEGRKSLLVASAVRGEGKTFVASALAISAARSGHKVLLVDGNACRPRVHLEFGSGAEPGLADVLRGDAPAAEAVRPSGTDGLNLVTLGKATPVDFGTLQEKGDLRTLLQDWEREHDLVVIDTPAAADGCDAVVMGRIAGHALVVVEDAAAPRRRVLDLLAALDAEGARVAGVVFNKVSALPLLPGRQ